MRMNHPPSQSPPDLTFQAVWSRARLDRPERVILLDGRDGSAFTVAEVDLLLRQAMAWLWSLGLRPGERFLVVATSELETLLVLNAALWLGVVPVVLHPETPPSRVDEPASATGAKVRLLPHAGGGWAEALIASLDTLTPLEPPPLTDPASEAAILYSSGSTGVAKGVSLSQAVLVQGAERVTATLGYVPGDRQGVIANFHTITGLRTCLTTSAMVGAVTALLSPQKSVAEVLVEARDADIDTFHPGARLVRAMILAPERFRPLLPPRLRLVSAGGGALSMEERQRFVQHFGVELANTYGATETAGMIAAAITTPGGRADRGVGRPLVPVRVLDAAGEPVPAGTLGEVEIGLWAPMLGYVHGGGVEERDGAWWVRPGDLGFLDADGFLHLRGRAQRLHMRQCGEKVLLDELEVLIRDLAQVDVAVVAVELPRREDQLCVLVEREALPPEWLAALLADLRVRLPEHAVPTVWEPTASLPRLPGGKVDLEGVRAQMSLWLEQGR